MHVRIFHDIIATCLNIVSDGAVHWSWGGCMCGLGCERVGLHGL